MSKPDQQKMLKIITMAAKASKILGTEQQFVQYLASLRNLNSKEIHKSVKSNLHNLRKAIANTINGGEKELDQLTVSNKFKKRQVRKTRKMSKETKIIKKHKCILCMKKIRIKDHYNKKHKLNLKIVSDNKTTNKTFCVHCNVDFKDAPNFTKHMVAYHKINTKMVKKYVDVLQKGGTKSFEKKTSDTILNETSQEFGNEEENVTVESVSNGLGSVRDERRELPDFAKVERYCRQCEKYVREDIFERHAAAHEVSERSQQTQEPSPTQENPPYIQLNSCAEPTVNRHHFAVPADGNCFFHSVIKLLNLTMKPIPIRRQLLASPLVDSCPKPEDVRSILSSDTEYADVDCVSIFSKVYNTNICVHYHFMHTEMEIVQYCYFKGNDSQGCIHLHLRDEHYTPLIEM